MDGRPPGRWAFTLGCLGRGGLLGSENDAAQVLPASRRTNEATMRSCEALTDGPLAVSTGLLELGDALRALGHPLALLSQEGGQDVAPVGPLLTRSH